MEKKEIYISLEWNDGSIETKMSVDGKAATDYWQVHHLLVALLKEIDDFERDQA